MSARKKQEEKHLQTLKSMQQLEYNKKCFECDQRGPTYIDVTIGSFVCTSCGGILRGLNPPHRIKSVSMATFTPAEIAFIESRGNEFCKNVYLGKFDSHKPRPDSKDHAKLKFFMEQKYEQKRWYVPPDQVQKSVKPNITTTKTETAKPLTSLFGKSPPQLKVETQKSPKVDNILGDFGSTPTSSAMVSQSTSNAGFADFGNAFTSQNFDAFGDFTSGTAPSAPDNTSKQSGFADFSNFLSPTSTNPQPTKNQTASPPTSKPTDKYADLADLFSSDGASSNADMWSGSIANNTSTVNWGSNSVYGTQPVNTSLNTNNQQGSVFGSPHASVFGNATQPQTSVFGNTAQQQQTSVFGNQSIPFSNAPQTNLNNQATNLFNNQQQANMFGNAVQSIPSSFGYTQSNVSTAGGFGSAQFSTQPLHGTTAPTSTFNSQVPQSFMSSGATAGNIPNPFMQSSYAPTPQMQAQNTTNPFMSPQQRQQIFPQSTGTNPFMSAPATGQQQMSTNPFF